MIIDQFKCVGCGMCVPFCPMKAISIQHRQAYIDLDLCVECGNCRFSRVCKKDAIVQQTLVMPRLIRAVFSNVREKSPNTGITGRGTEEMKTNDVTNRYPSGKFGIGCELGRPSTGATFRDVQTIAEVFVKHHAELETQNPTAMVFKEGQPGVVKEEFLNERVLSAIVEGMIDQEELPAFLEDLKLASEKVDTVFSVDLITKLEDGENPAMKYLEQVGITPRPNGKTCVGLGHM